MAQIQLLDLDDDAMFEILCHLDDISLCRLACVCKALYRAATDDELWHRLAIVKGVYPYPESSDPVVDWRAFYAENAYALCWDTTSAPPQAIIANNRKSLTKVETSSEYFCRVRTQRPIPEKGTHYYEIEVARTSGDYTYAFGVGNESFPAEVGCGFKECNGGIGIYDGGGQVYVYDQQVSTRVSSLHPFKRLGLFVDRELGVCRWYGNGKFLDEVAHSSLTGGGHPIYVVAIIMQPTARLTLLSHLTVPPEPLVSAL